MPVRLGTHTSKRTLLRLSGSREKRHGFAPTIIIAQPALRNYMTRLNLLYEMSRGQIDIDVNSYLQPHSEGRNRESHRYRYRQAKATRNIYFIPSSQGP